MDASPSPRTVVCGVDDSPAARAGLGVARDLAGALDLRLVVAHAARPLMVPRPPPIGVSYPPGLLDELRAGSVAAGERLLEDLLADLPADGHDRHVEIGAPAPVLLALARDRDAAFVVLGSRGLGGVARAVLGSVSRAALASAPCPVVIVPAGRAGD
ncbi:MAG: universal stress protein [Thermoleophilia bacterium]